MLKISVMTVTRGTLSYVHQQDVMFIRASFFQHKFLNQVFLVHLVFLKVNKHNIPFKDCVAILWLNNSLARLHEQDCPNSWKV